MTEDDTLQRFKRDNEMLKRSLRTLMKENEASVTLKVELKVAPQVLVPKEHKQKVQHSLFDDFKENIREIQNTNYELPSTREKAIPQHKQSDSSKHYKQTGQTGIQEASKQSGIQKEQQKTRAGENLLIERLSRQNQVIEEMDAKIRQLQMENRKLTDENYTCRQKIAIVQEQLKTIRKEEEVKVRTDEDYRRKNQQLAEQVGKYRAMAEELKQQREKERDIISQRQHQWEQDRKRDLETISLLQQQLNLQENNRETISELQLRILHHQQSEDQLAYKLSEATSANDVLRQLLDHRSSYTDQDDNTTDLLYPPLPCQNDHLPCEDSSTTELLLRGPLLTGLDKLRVGVHMINFINRLEKRSKHHLI